MASKQALSEFDNEEQDGRRPWTKRIYSSMASLTCCSLLRIFFFFILLGSVVFACYALPVEKTLKRFLLWVEHDLGPWGPIVLALAYVPLTILAVPASILTLGGGYLFGLPVGFIADSVGATIGAGAAFLLGRTIGKSYVKSKLKDYPQFKAIDIAIRRSGFKIVLLLRLVPLLPFNILNYLLSVTPVPIAHYMLASWIGMVPITLGLVYVGTTLKDLSDVTHEWGQFSKTRFVFVLLGLLISAVLVYMIMRVAKSALNKALSENEAQAPVMSELDDPLIMKMEVV